MGGTYRSPRWRLGLFGMLGLLYVVILVWYPEWTPRCVVRWISGYDCPACGTQRACRLLLQGEWRIAFLQNPYIVLIAPYLVAVVAAERCGGPDSRFRHLLKARAVVVGWVVLMLVWWILRNTALWQAFVEEMSV